MSRADAEASERSGSTNAGGIASILQDLILRKEASNGTDANGEPLWVYLGNHDIRFARSAPQASPAHQPQDVQDGRRFYDHELTSLANERLDGASGGSSGSFASSSPTRPSSSLGKIVLDTVLKVNLSDLSKVMDTNGEPLVVYHGTQAAKWVP